MLKKYFLKKYYPIFRAGINLCVGIPNSPSYLQVQDNQENYQVIERLILSGLFEDEIKSSKIYKELFKKGMLSEYSSTPNFNEQIRNELFFEYLDANNNRESRESILETNILVFGAGAGGSTLIYLLAQFGFKKLIVVDSDIVHIHDTHKTLIFKKKDIGKPKVDCLKNEIKENFNTDIKTFNSLPSSRQEIYEIIMMVKPDFIVKACDPELSFRYYLNEICFSNEIPFIYMSYAFERLNIGPLFIPGTTESDSEIEKISINKLGNQFSFLNHKKLFSDYTIHPSISFNINILSSLILKEIIFYLMGMFEYSLAINKEVFFVPLTYKVFFRDLSKLKE
jgi:hypothetical protein